LSASPRVGRTFGRVAEAYERTRPGYPLAAIERAAEELGLARDATVLDLGAGTGKLTRVLREVFAEVVAVEPDDEMRAFVGGDARAGTAEAIPLGDAQVDAVFAGAAFHWFEPEPTLAEIRRVLRPGGGLVLLWHDWWETERPPLPTEFRAILDELWARFEPARQSNHDWRRDVAPLGEAQFAETRGLSGRDFADLTLTASGPAFLDDDEREAIARRVYPLMAPSYELTVTTTVAWASPS
jgi:SAM-dependent methyltransferase